MDTLSPVDTALTRQGLADMLVEYVAERLANFVRPYQLRRELEEIISNLRGSPFKVNQESFDELIHKAQTFNAQQAGESSQKVAIKQICFLQNVMASGEHDIRAKLAANSQLTDLVGTSAKFRSELHEPQNVATTIRQMLSEMEELVDQEESVYN